MKSTIQYLLIQTLAAYSALACAPPTACPPEGFNSLTTFNLTEYTSAPWYVQQQKTLSYQPLSDLYCVQAVYKVINDSEVEVNNYSNTNGTNASPSSTAQLRAFIPDSQVKSKLKVGPKGAPIEAYSDYWVLAAGPREDHYEWALISGGVPKKRADNGFCDNEDTYNNAGLWIFYRKPIASPKVIHKVRKIAQEKGWDLRKLKPVIQKGCKYL
ncbi:hypothetical protein K7432_017805 [Basidiobolus ranarum]|uniref:Lipocalin/cytosolic fatty-acid binding domain-containing protein n=1 Tax=Basidiobolus ranarum TaxID=34480 RepID=A0ABR2WCX0_9FUNG